MIVIFFFLNKAFIVLMLENLFAFDRHASFGGTLLCEVQTVFVLKELLTNTYILGRPPTIAVSPGAEERRKLYIGLSCSNVLWL